MAIGTPARRRKRASDELDATDRQILDAIQSEFPLDPQPYHVLGERLGLSGREMIDRVARLKGTIIRQVSAIFDTRRIGYTSSLVAFAYPSDRVDAGAAIINRHPGVSHNYQRNHTFNVWFTLAVSPDADLDRHIDLLAQLSAPAEYVVLRTLRMYKIGVELDMSGARPITERTSVHSATDDWNAVVPLDALDRAVVVELQKDLPAVERPFAPLAANLGMTEDELFRRTTDLQARGVMRRYAAILRHRNAGYAFNAMGVWKVPEVERIDEYGRVMASFRTVSHCYRRPVYPQWPYSLFTMIHATTAGDCATILDAVSQATGLTDYAMLYSTKEYKKTRVEYFTGAERAWMRSVGMDA